MFNTLSQQTLNAGTKVSCTGGEHFWDQSLVVFFANKEDKGYCLLVVDQQLSPAKDTEVSLGKELLALSVTFFLRMDLKGHHVLFKVKLTRAKKA